MQFKKIFFLVSFFYLGQSQSTQFFDNIKKAALWHDQYRDISSLPTMRDMRIECEDGYAHVNSALFRNLCKKSEILSPERAMQEFLDLAEIPKNIVDLKVSKIGLISLLRYQNCKGSLQSLPSLLRAIEAADRLMILEDQEELLDDIAKRYINFVKKNRQLGFLEENSKSFFTNVQTLEDAIGRKILSFISNKFTCIKVLNGFLAASPDNTLIACRPYQNGVVRLWDAASGDFSEPLDECPKFSCECAAISYDNELIVFGSESGILYLCKRASREFTEILLGDQIRICYVSISPDNKHILSASEDGTIRLLEIASGKCIKTFKGHTRPIRYVSISSDRETLISLSADRIMKVWNLNTGECIRSLDNCLAISPDNNRVVSRSTEGFVSIHDTYTATCYSKFKDCSAFISCVAISSDNNFVVSGAQNGFVRMWDAATGKYIKTLGYHKECVNTIAISSDNKVVLSGSRNDGCLKIWNTYGEECVNTQEYKQDFVDSLKRNAYVVSTSSGNTCKIWENQTLKTWQEKQSLIELLKVIAEK